MDTEHSHTAVHHILPSGYVPVHEYPPSHNNNTLPFQIPESHLHNYGHNETSTDHSDSNEKKSPPLPVMQPASLFYLYNIHDLNELPFGYRKNTADLLPVNNQMFSSCSS